MIQKEPDFKVFVNQMEIPVVRVSTTFAERRVTWDGDCYGICVFDSDESVQVEIRCDRDLSAAEILPENAIPDARISADKISFRLENHGSYVIEPQGYQNIPLCLFFNPAEKDVPAPDAPGVRYFGPGVHSPGKIELQSNETLYLASGAIVEAVVWAQGDHIKICGHGILTQRSFPRAHVRHCVDFFHCNHVEMRDFVLTDPCFWSIVLRDCSDVQMDRVRICGGRMLNDDGIDICNTTDVTIRNCFIRTQDDNIAIKGHVDEIDLLQVPAEVNETSFSPDSRGVKNVLVENCIFWCDFANVIRVGYECIAEAMENVVMRNCDVVHVSDIFRSPEEYWAHAVWYFQASHRMPMRNFLFEGWRIRVDIPKILLLKAVAMECPPWSDFGSICHCTFRNIAITGDGGDILIAGHDAASPVENITLENVTVNGQKIDGDYARLTVGDFASNICFA